MTNGSQTQKLQDLDKRTADIIALYRKHPDIDIYIRRQWNDWKVGRVPLKYLSGLHWTDISGGVQRSAPQPFIHGYVLCTDIDGEVSHSGSHGPCPHNIKVCVVTIDNDATVWKVLLQIVGAKPQEEKKGGKSSKK